MSKPADAIGIEINPKLVGVLFTERIGKTLRVFCFYTNSDISQFDVPAEENLDNLRALFSKLSMEETCTSLIVEEVVQGRIFLKSEDEHWVYTVLKSPGDAMPPMNADIATLPWRVVWTGQTAEVLQYTRNGEEQHCFAIRTRISENDVIRLMQTSKTFTNPVSVARKQPHRWLYANIAAALVGVALVIGGTIYYTFRPNHPLAAKPIVAAASTPAARSYFLLHNHRISGPYPATVISDLSAGGLVNVDTLFRAPNSVDWLRLTDLPLAQPQK